MNWFQLICFWCAVVVTAARAQEDEFYAPQTFRQVRISFWLNLPPNGNRTLISSMMGVNTYPYSTTLIRKASICCLIRYLPFKIFNDFVDMTCTLSKIFRPLFRIDFYIGLAARPGFARAYNIAYVTRG